MTSIIISCTYCKKKFLRDRKHVNENARLGHKYYCSITCISLNRRRQKKILCENSSCSKKFFKIVSAISLHNFCSRSCAASVNNSKFPKNPGIRKICLMCQKLFIGREKYCSFSCKSKGQMITPEIIIQQIKNFYNKYERIPLKREFIHTKAAQKRFGSWNKAIETAGFKPNPIMFAKKYIAKDKHRCDSLAEKIIDDWLSQRNILHVRSICYPGNPALTVDFIVEDFWIEFFGLSGHKRYDELKKEKLQLAKIHKLKFIAIYPQDLFPKNKLSDILVPLIT